MLWLRRVFYVLLIASSISFALLHNYSAIQDCHFPSPSPRVPRWTPRFISPQSQAPFRLLAFGDPQLEGDTSIPYVIRDSYRPSKLRLRLSQNRNPIKVLLEAVTDFFQYGILGALYKLRKQADLIGNDYYLAHIYQTLQRQTDPTHVTVLGDLLGSQWIDDTEFERRARRYWKRVFKNGIRVEDEITEEPTMEVLGEDKSWKQRIINIAGNHDIGYAGDLTKARLARFERAFGAPNWEIVFQVPSDRGDPAYLRLIILNSMNLDTPALDGNLQSQTYKSLNDIITRSEAVENRSVGTILLTHIPLHKQEGVCADAPYFSYGSNGHIREQNHLSEHSSRSILEGVFGISGNTRAPYHGLGRKGIIINGHDHEGCDVWHYLPRISSEADASSRQWNASRYEDSFLLTRATTVQKDDQYMPGIREVTLRSMMGEYGGWAYLVSGWVDNKTNEWRFEVSKCSAGVQHIWWAVHILVLATAGIGGFLGISSLLGSSSKPAASVSIPTAHKRVPSITLTPVYEDAISPTSSVPRPPSPFDHFNGNMEMSGGRARRRRSS